MLLDAQGLTGESLQSILMRWIFSLGTNRRLQEFLTSLILHHLTREISRRNNMKRDVGINFVSVTVDHFILLAK